jgi:hypothetical protein
MDIRENNRLGSWYVGRKVGGRLVTVQRPSSHLCRWRHIRPINCSPTANSAIGEDFKTFLKGYWWNFPPLTSLGGSGLPTIALPRHPPDHYFRHSSHPSPPASSIQLKQLLSSVEQSIPTSVPWILYFSILIPRLFPALWSLALAGRMHPVHRDL